MNGFFTPLLRKIGVVALALACGLCLFWVRSLSISDRVEISLVGTSAHHFESGQGGIEWTWWSVHPAAAQPVNWISQRGTFKSPGSLWAISNPLNVIAQVASDNDTSVEEAARFWKSIRPLVIVF